MEIDILYAPKVFAVTVYCVYYNITLPETNISPENEWLEYVLVSFWGVKRPIFRGKLAVSFREGNLIIHWIILLMAEILHHNGINYLSTGAGFQPSTVLCDAAPVSSFPPTWAGWLHAWCRSYRLKKSTWCELIYPRGRSWEILKEIWRLVIGIHRYN